MQITSQFGPPLPQERARVSPVCGRLWAVRNGERGFLTLLQGGCGKLVRIFPGIKGVAAIPSPSQSFVRAIPARYVSPTTPTEYSLKNALSFCETQCMMTGPGLVR